MSVQFISTFSTCKFTIFDFVLDCLNFNQRIPIPQAHSKETNRQNEPLAFGKKISQLGALSICVPQIHWMNKLWTKNFSSLKFLWSKSNSVAVIVADSVLPDLFIDKIGPKWFTTFMVIASPFSFCCISICFIHLNQAIFPQHRIMGQNDLFFWLFNLGAYHTKQSAKRRATTAFVCSHRL